MKWFKGQPKEAVNPEVFKKPISPEAFTLFLLNVGRSIVKDASQTVKKYLSATERSKLSKVEEELFLFVLFALDYWIQNSARTQEERHILTQAFRAHLANVAGGGYEGQAIMNTYQERFATYGQIVTEKKGDEAKFLGFGMKLSELCGLPPALFLGLAPSLFTQAYAPLVGLASVRLKLR